VSFSAILLRLRSLWPRRVRTRLAILYAVLFLIAGSALLALTYGLLANRLPHSSSKFISHDQAAAFCRRKTEGSFPSPKEPQSGHVPASLLAKCTQSVVEAARLGSQAQRDQTLNTMLEVALIGLAIATVASGALGWIVSGRVLRPTEQALASRQRFLANASHELRTPLSAMRTALDVTLSKPAATPEQLRSMGTRVSRSVDQASATVDALLTLTSAEASVRQRGPVDLGTASEDALDAAAAEIASRELHVETSLEPAQILGDRVLIERLVGNLVDNAVRHNVLGGAVELRTLAHNGTAELTISNTGPVLDPALIPTLFEPFSRAERVRSTDGVGLGLSIVQAIAISHGATITALANPGGGLEVSVSFPA
jgi:signal transduction histidine kinase